MTATLVAKTLKAAQIKKSPVLYVRTIADVLCRHLEAANTTVHWAVPAGGETSWGPPKLVWPDEPDLGYFIEEGANEGMKVSVIHQADRRDQATQLQLITIKFLCSRKTVFAEAVHVAEFFATMDVQKMLEIQVSPKVRYQLPIAA